jgi:hypothetical protein
VSLDRLERGGARSLWRAEQSFVDEIGIRFVSRKAVARGS